MGKKRSKHTLLWRAWMVQVQKNRSSSCVVRRMFLRSPAALVGFGLELLWCLRSINSTMRRMRTGKDRKAQQGDEVVSGQQEEGALLPANVSLLCFMDIQVSFMITGNFKRRKSDSSFGSEVRQLRFPQRQQSSWRPLAPLWKTGGRLRKTMSAKCVLLKNDWVVWNDLRNMLMCFLSQRLAADKEARRAQMEDPGTEPSETAANASPRPESPPGGLNKCLLNQ